MYKIVVTLFALFVLSSGEYLTKEQFSHDVNFTTCSPSTDEEDIYKFSIEHLNTSLPNITFSSFKGKVLLLVNVATYCRSATEYPLLNKLLEEFPNDLVIVGFPCQQFLSQEPGATAEEIYNAIKYVRPGNGFVPKFTLTKKIEVNGGNTHPIFSFLKRSCPSTRHGFNAKEHILYDPKTDRDLRWNFEKFLIHPMTGKPVHRYDEVYEASKIAPHIKELIMNNHRVF